MKVFDEIAAQEMRDRVLPEGKRYSIDDVRVKTTQQLLKAMAIGEEEAAHSKLVFKSGGCS